LNDALNEVGSGSGGPQSNADLIQEIFRRGLPLVPDVMPADRITVYARHGLGRLVSLASWPGGGPEVCADAAELPEIEAALRTDTVVLAAELCFVPIGYCSEGELVMVVRRTATDHIDHRTTDAAEALAAAFLRATSRANFVCDLQTESRTDPLTGLANRRTLYERIQIEMEHALRSETPLSVAMIDLDHFKDYNDRYGHVAGDTLLRSIAALLVSNIRGQDLVVRYGGEEFCLVMPDTDILGGHHLLDKLRAGGREATSEFGITLSAGLTSWDGIEDTTSMIERADQALYRAKQSGRDRVVSIQSVTEF
jgi:diguanylate cyclase (GGDEF)-like protein